MDWSEYFWKHTIWQIPHAFHENIDILSLVSRKNWDEV